MHLKKNSVLEGRKYSVGDAEWQGKQMQMVIIISLTFSDTVVTVLDYHPKLQFHFKEGIIIKNSYKRSVYESVEDKSLS